MGEAWRSRDVPRGGKGVAIGLFVAAFSLLPMAAAIGGAPAEVPAGRLPAFCGGATFFFCGVWIVLAALGSTSPLPIALLLTAFAATPLSLAAPGLLGGDLEPGSLLPLGVGFTFVAGLAGVAWADGLREWAAGARKPHPRARHATDLLVGLALVPFLGVVAAIVVPGAALLLPLAALALAATAALNRLGGRGAPLPLGALVPLVALPLALAPERAVLRLLALTGAPVRPFWRLVDAHPVTLARLDVWSGGMGVLAAALVALAPRLLPAPAAERFRLLPGPVHAGIASALSLALAASSLAALHPESLPWRLDFLGAAAKSLPGVVQRDLLWLGSAEADERAEAVRDLLGRTDLDLTESADDLFALLESGDPGVRAAAATVLRTRVRLDATARERLPLVRACLEDPESEVRRFAAGAFAVLAPDASAAVAGLAPLLADGSLSVRKAAVEALGALGEEGSEPLFLALAKAGSDTRFGLVAALEAIHQTTPARLRLYRRLLASTSAPVRAHGADGLKDMKADGAAAANALAALLADADAGVRESAFLALLAVAPDAAEKLPSDALGRILTVPLWAARVEARKRLTARGATFATLEGVLLEALDSHDTYVREEALRDLLRLDAPPEVLPRVARVVREDDRQGTRAAAAALIAAIGPRAGAAGAAALLEIANGQDGYASSQALAALEAIGREARRVLPALEARLRSASGAEADHLVRVVARLAAPPTTRRDHAPPVLSFAFDGSLEPAAPARDVTATVAGGAAFVPGRRGQALALDDRGLSLAWGERSPIGPSFAIALWIRIERPNPRRPRAAPLLDTDPVQVWLHPGGTVKLGWQPAGGFGVSASAPALPTGSWVGLAVVHDRTDCSLRLHVGAAASPGQFPYEWSREKGLLLLSERLGRIAIGGPGWSLAVDDLRLYDRPLAPDELPPAVTEGS